MFKDTCSDNKHKVKRFRHTPTARERCIIAWAGVAYGTDRFLQFLRHSRYRQPRLSSNPNPLASTTWVLGLKACAMRNFWILFYILKSTIKLKGWDWRGGSATVKCAFCVSRGPRCCSPHLYWAAHSRL